MYIDYTIEKGIDKIAKGCQFISSDGNPVMICYPTEDKDIYLVKSLNARSYVKHLIPMNRIMHITEDASGVMYIRYYTGKRNRKRNTIQAVFYKE